METKFNQFDEQEPQKGRDDLDYMAQSNIKNILSAAQYLNEIFDENTDNLPDWVEDKLSKCDVLLDGVYKYFKNKKPMNEKKDPCWEGYKQVGMKKKDGKEVPNCVPDKDNKIEKSDSSKSKKKNETKIFDFDRFEILEAKEKDSRLSKAGVEGYNKPKRTPSHPTKSHIVVAKEGDKVKTIRFGEQGAKTAGKPKEGESDKMKKKRKSFKARHAKNISKGKMSAAYWADKVKW